MFKIRRTGHSGPSDIVALIIMFSLYLKHLPWVNTRCVYVCMRERERKKGCVCFLCCSLLSLIRSIRARQENFFYFASPSCAILGIFDQFKRRSSAFHFSKFNKAGSLVDNLLQRLEKYSSNLEKIVDEKVNELRLEKHKSEELLRQMLPK